MNLAILLAFGAMIGWGLGDFLIQKTINKIGPIGTLCWISLFSSIILIPFVVSDLKNITQSQYITLIILGLANFASGYIHFKALEIGKLSVVEIIMSIELPLTILLGILFFRESLSLWQIFLIIILFIGIILISIDTTKINKKDFLEKGSLLAIFSGVLIAIVNFGSASQAKEISPLMALWIPWFVCGLICFARLSQNNLKTFFRQSAKNWPLVLIMVIVDLLAWTSYVFAVAREELSITIAITESYVVIALALGIIINKEKITKIQYFGAGLAVCGSLLIGLTSK
ncbi:MAG: DMT family transporter [Candidatus Falkowbacteria bacterium]